MSDVKREWFDVDYYKVLGVESSATAKEITTAYRALARKFHPDANPDDATAEDRFKEISAAYDVVGDESRRKEYDQVRRMGPMGNVFGGGGRRPQGSPAGAGPGEWDFEGMGDLGDLLGSVLGGFGGRSGPQARPGADFTAKLDIPFDEAMNGMTTTLAVGPQRHSVTVKVPPGIETGQRLRIRGKGGPGSGNAPAGDLLVTIKVGDHPIFGRSKKNLTIEAPITFAEAALGADIKVPTFEGPTVTVRIPPGTQTGKKFRVKGRGVKTAKSAGDLLVTVTVAVPTKLNKTQREALEAYAAEEAESPRAHWTS